MDRHVKQYADRLGLQKKRDARLARSNKSPVAHQAVWGRPAHGWCLAASAVSTLRWL